MIPRIFIDQTLSTDLQITLDQDQYHYLINVLRLKEGTKIKIFNFKDGEFLAEIESCKSKKIILSNLQFSKTPHASKELWLAFSLIKHDPLNFMLEKVTELGVTHIQPIITDRCNIKSLKIDRWVKNVTAASEQCERFDIPKILPIINLKQLLTNKTKINWVACLERSDSISCDKVFKFQDIKQDQAYGFIIGPEGGFSDNERLFFSSCSNIKIASLGHNILRAETAAITAIAGIYLHDYKIR
jgi:16S rRNA (uracil1498-N3)-methyltransferase